MPSSGADDDADIAPGSRAKRARRNTIQDDFVDSSMLQIGSSSPLADGSLEASSVGYVDAESHSQLSFPEDETVRLISCALRHILYFGPPQDSPDCRIVVEFRDARTRLLALTPVLGRKLIATDDGGLCLRDGSDGLFTLSRDRVAILEAKRKFSSLIDGVPVISDDCFAQMTCEALVARLADPLGELHGNKYVAVL
ncbi:hypothetical protein O9K51_09771 [Purpureocillium lavendulum]|uniref:Uncharacterized protein n=1 Tax=Purpureocillium lavendulum TaxID=1247861 RepID=A0AB34FGU2_9HYPO|nr:hypothetical protein O9K51_09771 [Purpureocillium lavendulum]